VDYPEDGYYGILEKHGSLALGKLSEIADGALEEKRKPLMIRAKKKEGSKTTKGLFAGLDEKKRAKHTEYAKRGEYGEAVKALGIEAGKAGMQKLQQETRDMLSSKAEITEDDYKLLLDGLMTRNRQLSDYLADRMDRQPEGYAEGSRNVLILDCARKIADATDVYLAMSFIDSAGWAPAAFRPPATPPRRQYTLPGRGC